MRPPTCFGLLVALFVAWLLLLLSGIAYFIFLGG